MDAFVVSDRFMLKFYCSEFFLIVLGLICFMTGSCLCGWGVVCLFYVLFSALFVNAQILFLIQTGSVCIREPNRTYVLCT